MRRIFVIGASAGGLAPLKQICSSLPADFPSVILIVVHVGSFENHLPLILARETPLQVRKARDGEVVAKPAILVAPSDRHMLVERHNDDVCIKLSSGPRENHTRPAIDPTFRTAAAVFGSDVVGIILSGHLNDGTVGLEAIKECGGFTIVQEPRDCSAADMSFSAIANVQIDMVLNADQIGPAMIKLAKDSTSKSEQPSPVPEWVYVENKFASNMGNMDDLRKVAVVSVYSCPECSGNLWELKAGKVKRFRCHTGHSYTADALSKLQQRTVEDALWVALRALHEQKSLAGQRASELSDQEGGLHREAAERADKAALVIRDLLNGED